MLGITKKFLSRGAAPDFRPTPIPPQSPKIRITARFVVSKLGSRLTTSPYSAPSASVGERWEHVSCRLMRVSVRYDVSM